MLLVLAASLVLLQSFEDYSPDENTEDTQDIPSIVLNQSNALQIQAVQSILFLEHAIQQRVTWVLDPSSL